jgi:hypothetical protein
MSLNRFDRAQRREWETSDDVSSWNDGDDVLVCGDDKMINTAANEAIDVTER